MHTDYFSKYIEDLEKKIMELVKSESQKMTADGEKMLHVLFENCKHAKRYMEDYGHKKSGSDMMDSKKSYLSDNPY